MTFAELVASIALELNIDTTNARLLSQMYAWGNTIYRTVVSADEFPWRRRDVPLLTLGAGTGTCTFTNGQTTHGYATDCSGITTDGSSYNFLVLDGYDMVYELENVESFGTTAIIELRNEFVHPTAEYDFTIYHPRYNLGVIREDWITSVYNHTNETPLRRVYPNDSTAYLHRAMVNPAAPQYYFMGGANDTTAMKRSSFLAVSPSPDSEYELTVKMLLGTTELTEDSSTVIIPDEWAPDVFKYGIGMLYAVKQKDKEAFELYKGLYGSVLRNMLDRTSKEPGRSRRLRGYTIRDAGVRDIDLPADWDVGWTV